MKTLLTKFLLFIGYYHTHTVVNECPTCGEPDYEVFIRRQPTDTTEFKQERCCYNF